MDVKKVREWPRVLASGVALVVLATLSSVRVICAAEMRETFEDRFAEADIRDAAQDIDRMGHILGPVQISALGQRGWWVRNLMRSPRICMSHRINPWTSAMSASRYLSDTLKGKGDKWLPQLPFIKPKWPRIAVIQVQVAINF